MTTKPASVFKTKAIGVKMISRQLHRRDDAETGCQAISLVSYLETANEKLLQAVAELMRETAALRQEVEKMEGREKPKPAGRDAATVSKV